MKPFHWVWFGIACACVLIEVAVLGYELACMQGWIDAPTITALTAGFGPLGCFIAGNAVGLVVGVIVGHLYFPRSMDPEPKRRKRCGS